MKLYLSSYRIPTPDDLIALLDRTPGDTKVAVIPNAQDYYAERARTIKIRDVTTYLRRLEFSHTNVVDLRNYTDPTALKADLQTYDLIWVMGGNTFCLSYEARRSGLKEVLREVLNGGVVYGGESAGALLAGNSLKGVEFADEPEFAEEIVWDTLELLPHFILPHADNANFAEAIQKSRDLHHDDPSMIELNDNQALVRNQSLNKITSG